METHDGEILHANYTEFGVDPSITKVRGYFICMGQFPWWLNQSQSEIKINDDIHLSESLQFNHDIPYWGVAERNGTTCLKHQKTQSHIYMNSSDWFAVSIVV